MKISRRRKVAGAAKAAPVLGQEASKSLKKPTTTNKQINKQTNKQTNNAPPRTGESSPSGAAGAGIF